MADSQLTLTDRKKNLELSTCPADIVRCPLSAKATRPVIWWQIRIKIRIMYQIMYQILVFYNLLKLNQINKLCKKTLKEFKIKERIDSESLIKKEKYD